MAPADEILSPERRLELLVQEDVLGTAEPGGDKTVFGKGQSQHVKIRNDLAPLLPKVDGSGGDPGGYRNSRRAAQLGETGGADDYRQTGRQRAGRQRAHQ